MARVRMREVNVLISSQRAKDVIHGRLVHGHIVDEDFPSPSVSARSGPRENRTHSSASSDGDGPLDMGASMYSTTSSYKRFGGEGDNEHALGGSADAAQSKIGRAHV